MFHTVPNWLERLLGIPAEAGEGTVWNLEYAWPWPPWVTLLFAAVAVIFVVGLYLHESRTAGRVYRLSLATVRLTILGLIALMIAQMTLSLKRTGLPYVAVLLDDSQSMTVVDHYPDKLKRVMENRLKTSGVDASELSRWNLAQTLLAEREGRLLRGAADGHKLRLYYLTDGRASQRSDVPGIVEEIGRLEPKGESTRLGAGIRSALDDLRGATPAAVVLLTDGVNTAGPTLADAAEYARRRGVPLYFIGLGSERPVRDLKLTDLLVDDVVFVDDIVNFECKLSASGFEGQKVVVTLREKGKKATPENVLARVELTLGPDAEPRPIRLQYRPTKVGQYEYVVEVEPQEGESMTENNRQSRIVQVRKEKIRVLLVQAYPNFEFRYLRNMLERDETIALHSVLQDADPEHAEQDSASLRAFPSRRDDLFAYDVVILGDVNPALLPPTALKDLADFVDQPAKGGALAMIAGPSFMPAAFYDTPLGPLLPMKSADRVRYPAKSIAEGFRVQPTDLGLATPAMQLGDTPEETLQIWKDLAPLYWLLEMPELKPGVRVLAERSAPSGADGRRLPVICLQYVGAGKVLFHATDETWRWRYRTGDVYFARYWVQMIRYLCRSKLTDAGGSALLATDRREYAQGDSVRLRVRFADERQAPVEDDGVTVVVEQPGRKTQRITMHRASGARGVFEGVVERPAVGSYHAWIAAPALEGRSPAADFSVIPPPGEFARVQMDAGEMRQAAKTTGGRFYTFETADRLVGDLPPGRQVPIESLPPLPLWNRWSVLALFLALLVAEWVLRKLRGMV